MTLESLDSLLGSGKERRSLRRTGQAFAVSAKIRQLSQLEVNVVIRDRAVIIEVGSAAEATKLSLLSVQIEQLVKTAVGQDHQVRIKVKRTGQP